MSTGTPVDSAPSPRVVAWETTRRCQLNCRHCRGSARDADYAGELTTSECMRVVDSIGELPGPILILTGGEPMYRDDIYDIASHSSSLGIRTVMAPCGPLLNDESVGRLKAAGISRISISLDGANEEEHDAFRGVSGAYAKTMKGLECARSGGLEFQINTTVTNLNVQRLPELVDLAIQLGAAAMDIFFLVPVGRGKLLEKLAIGPVACEKTLKWIASISTQCPIPVRTTCAPQYVRFIDSSQSQRFSGCMAGNGFVFISHLGKLQPCGFLDLECGDLRTSGFDLLKLYRESTIFKSLRNYGEYKGKCATCEYMKACGGCRARAFAAEGDYLCQDPTCLYQPVRTRGNDR